jgi:hypothetical protein
MRYLKKQNTNTTILNGRGIIYDAAELATIESTSALLLPKGTTGGRPTAVEGMIRYNTTTQNFEAYEANIAFGTPGWKKFRTDEPKLIHAQNLGNGDNVESLFGPLDANDAQTPVPIAPAQVLCMVENVLQIPTTNYIFIQNPCFYSSNQISFFADISISGKPGAGAFAAGTSAAFSNNAAVVDFADAGFYVGQTIFVSGSTNNNGTYTVASVSSTFLEVNETFINENDPGYATVETIEGLVNQSVESGTFSQTLDSAADVIQLNSISGLEVDNMIMFDVTTGNIVADTIYFVKSIDAAANQITISATAGGATFDLADATTPGNWTAGLGYGRQPSGSSIAYLTFAPQSLTTTAATGNGVTATLSFATQTLAPFYVGQTITVAGITPAGYNNASAVVTACTVNSVSYANATSAAQTVAGTITAVGNAIALNSTAGMAVGQEISFTGTNFGNLVDGTTYFIKQILDATHLTISATYGGAVFVLTLAAGYMQVATLGNNLYVYFGTPVPSSKPVTILHNFDK